MALSGLVSALPIICSWTEITRKPFYADRKVPPELWPVGSESVCWAKATTHAVYFVACSWSLELQEGWAGIQPGWDPSAHQGMGQLGGQATARRGLCYLHKEGWQLGASRDPNRPGWGCAYQAGPRIPQNFLQTLCLRPDIP
jgi:hypothetical protein